MPMPPRAIAAAAYVLSRIPPRSLTSCSCAPRESEPPRAAPRRTVERIAARHQAQRGPVVQSLNVRQNARALAAARRASTSAGRSGYDSTMRPRPTKSHSPSRTLCCADVRQPLLQVAVGRADEHQPRKVALQERGRPNLPRDAAQRILRRLVAVERRKHRRPLHVRVVVRAAGGRRRSSGRRAARASAARRARPRAPRRAARRSSSTPNPNEAAALAPVLSRRRALGLADRRRPRLRYGTVSNTERRTTISSPGRCARMPSITRRMKRVRFSSEPPYGPLRAAGAEQLVPEIAVARLDVDEAEAGVARQPRRGDEVVDQAIELVVLEHAHAVRKAAIEHRIARTRRAAPGDRRRRAARSAPSASAAGRRTDRASAFAPNRSRCAATSSSRSAAIAGWVARRHQQLMRIGAAVVADRDRFPAPHQLRAADAEIAPAPARQIARLAVARAVPPFHRQDAEAVADAHAVAPRSAARAATRRARPARRRTRAGCRCARGARETPRRSSAMAIARIGHVAITVSSSARPVAVRVPMRDARAPRES